MNNLSNTTFAISIVKSSEALCTQSEALVRPHDHLQVSEKNEISDVRRNEKQQDGSYKVLNEPQPIGHPHGMTEAEIRLVSEAERYICDLDCTICYTVLSDADLTESKFRYAVRGYLNRITQDQQRAGIQPTYVAVFEGTPRLHVNILFPLPVRDRKKVICRLSKSKHFGSDGIHVALAKGEGWFTRYTAKERTHADRFIPGIPVSKRRPGHHRLGQLGGERVRLSKHLESQLISDKKMIARKRKNAKKSLSLLNVKHALE